MNTIVCNPVFHGWKSVFENDTTCSCPPGTALLLPNPSSEPIGQAGGLVQLPLHISQRMFRGAWVLLSSLRTLTTGRMNEVSMS